MFLQTITASMVTTLLFVIVFSIAIDRNAGFHQVPFITFCSRINYDECYPKFFANASSAFMTQK